MLEQELVYPQSDGENDQQPRHSMLPLLKKLAPLFWPLFSPLVCPPESNMVHSSQLDVDPHPLNQVLTPLVVWEQHPKQIIYNNTDSMSVFAWCPRRPEVERWIPLNRNCKLLSATVWMWRLNWTSLRAARTLNHWAFALAQGKKIFNKHVLWKMKTTVAYCDPLETLLKNLLETGTCAIKGSASVYLFIWFFPSDSGSHPHPKKLSRQ